MLELRPNCECCDRDLPGDSGDALICTFECTFCRDELLARPRRPRDALARHPASSRRVVRPGGCPE